MLDLSIVIVTYNTKDLTLDCLSSIFNKAWKINFEVWVLDNGMDGTDIDIKKKFPKVNVIKSEENLGFSKGNNKLIKKVYKTSEYVLLLNSDTQVTESALDNLLQFTKDNNFDIASCYLKNPNGSFQANSGDIPTLLPVIFWLSGLDGVLNKIFLVPSFHQDDKKYYINGRKVGWISGSVMLIKSAVFDAIGFLDEKIFMYGEDVDFCMRACGKGLKVGWTDKAKIIHIGGASTNAPKYNQWRGEFLGLLYLYKKYFGTFGQSILKVLIYFFILVRTVLYTLTAKFDYAKTYAKIAFNI